MGERNVVRTAEVYRAYSGIAAATVSGVLRMSPMARERSTSAAWPSRSVAFVVSLCLAQEKSRQAGRQAASHGRPRWHDEIDERSVNFNRHFIEA